MTGSRISPGSTHGSPPGRRWRPTKYAERFYEIGSLEGLEETRSFLAKREDGGGPDRRDTLADREDGHRS